MSHKLLEKMSVQFAVRKRKEFPRFTSSKSPDENSIAHFLFDLSPVLMPSALDFVPTNLWGSAVWLQQKGQFFWQEVTVTK